MNEKVRVGRPKEYPEGRKRTKAILVRVTENELLLIESKMKSLGEQNREAFVRRVLLEQME